MQEKTPKRAFFLLKIANYLPMTGLFGSDTLNNVLYAQGNQYVVHHSGSEAGRLANFADSHIAISGYKVNDFVLYFSHIALLLVQGVTFIPLRAQRYNIFLIYTNFSELFHSKRPHIGVVLLFFQEKQSSNLCI